MTRKWTFIVLLAALIRATNFQFAPFFGPPSPPIVHHVPVPVPVPQPVPQPVAVPHPVPMPIAFEIRRKTTTTKAPESDELSLAYPIPMPIQFAAPPHPIPAFCIKNPKHKRCPPCPPCVCSPLCTPSFFSYCSSCHKKCRCVNGANAPVPMPPFMPPPMPPMAPMPAPSPLLIVPFPPVQPPKIVRKDSSSDSSDSSTDSDSSTERRRRFRKRRRNFNRRKNYRRQNNFRRSNNFRVNNAARKNVQPVLSYISSDGDVKFEKRLTNDDVETLFKKEIMKKKSMALFLILTIFIAPGMSQFGPYLPMSLPHVSGHVAFPHPSLPILVQQIVRKPLRIPIAIQVPPIPVRIPQHSSTTTERGLPQFVIPLYPAIPPFAGLPVLL